MVVGFALGMAVKILFFGFLLRLFAKARVCQKKDCNVQPDRRNAQKILNLLKMILYCFGNANLEQKKLETK